LIDLVDVVTDPNALRRCEEETLDESYDYGCYANYG
jgi:hypothetical protein